MSKERRSGARPETEPTGLITREQIIRQIPVDYFIERFHVENPLVQEVLWAHPTLCYELGNVTPETRTVHNHADNITNHVYLVTEGSAKFGLKNPADAKLWAGIENHGIRTAFHIQYALSRFKNLKPKDLRKVKKVFEDAGFSFSEFDQFDLNSLPQLSRDAFFPSHLTRRRYDERNRYHLSDAAHPEGTTGQTAKALLEEFNAPQILWHLIKKVEDHDDHMLKEIGEKRYFPNILDALYTYCDWTFNQETVSLDERFKTFLTERDELKRERLMLFRDCGKYFEEVFNRAFSAVAKDGKPVDILSELKNLKPTYKEKRIREAYCAPSGITLQESFPKFAV